MLPFSPLGSRVIPFRDVAVLNEDILLPIKRKPKEFQKFSNNVFPEFRKLVLGIKFLSDDYPSMGLTKLPWLKMRPKTN